MVDDALVGRVVDGDNVAWQALQVSAAELIERWARANPRMRRANLRGNVDDGRDVLALALERLCKDQFRTLRKYLEQTRMDPPTRRSFDQWLFRVTDYAVRDHLRARYGRAPAADSNDVLRLSKRDMHTLAPRFEAEDRALAHRSEFTAKQTLREIMLYVRSTYLPDEAEALRLCFEVGASYDEIASTLGLADAKRAETLIRMLKERLRVRFREGKEADGRSGPLM